jgi:hypothetical protein
VARRGFAADARVAAGAERARPAAPSRLARVRAALRGRRAARLPSRGLRSALLRRALRPARRVRRRRGPRARGHRPPRAARSHTRGSGQLLAGSPGRARLVLPLAGRPLRRVRALRGRRRAERAARCRGRGRRAPSRSDPVHVLRASRVASGLERLLLQRRPVLGLRGSDEVRLLPSPGPGWPRRTRADPGPGRVLRLPAALDRRALSRCGHERDCAARVLRPGAAGRLVAAVRSGWTWDLLRRLRRRRVRRGRDR